MVGEVARGLSLFGGASSEVRRCNCSVVDEMRASFLPGIYLSIYLSIQPYRPPPPPPHLGARVLRRFLR